MFRHKGKARTFTHNFRLAAFLSFIAGIVNICGVLALGVLTTNVTGHFAYFAEGVLKKSDTFGVQFLFYLLAFLSGSFISSLLTEYYIHKEKRSPHNAAMLLEILLLLIIGLFGNRFINDGISKPLLACTLLFAMGLQNSLVSKVSSSAVRTTHLTGLFTDLGIELSQLFFYKEANQRQQLLRSIGLHSGIIFFFFAGCVAGGICYLFIGLNTLVVATIILILTLIYDNLTLGYYRVRRRLRTGN